MAEQIEDKFQRLQTRVMVVKNDEKLFPILKRSYEEQDDC